MYKFYVGIDVSKDVLDVAVKLSEEIKYIGQFSNSHKGFKLILKALRNIGKVKISDGFFCFENTGIYSKALLEYLLSQELACREENPIQIKRSIGLRRGKSDRVDAISICRYAFEKRDTISVSKLDKPLIIKMKRLLSRRELLVKQKIALQLSLRENIQMIDLEIQDFLNRMLRRLVPYHLKPSV